MTNSDYPWYVPKKGATGDDAKDKVLVATPDQHKATNPEHYEAEQEKRRLRKNPGAVIAAEIAAERERCARIAEFEQRGNKLGIAIAAKIRAGGPKPAIAIEPDPKPSDSQPVESQTLQDQQGAPQAA